MKSKISFRMLSVSGIGIMFLFSTLYLFPQVKEKTVTELISKDEKTVVIPIKDITGTARYYSFKSKDIKKVQFFVLLDNVNQVHVAFDACEICYQAKKGYRQEGSLTVCNNCGNKYAVKSIGVANKTGGCWPAYLPVTADKDNIIIKVSDLALKQYLFP